MVRLLAHHHAPSLLQVIAVSEYKKQKPVRYFSLPAEIRNMIMQLVFVPGEVLLNASETITRYHKPSMLQGALHRMKKTVAKRGEKDSNITCVPQLPGFQLLATCKQACAEGLTVFYSLNVFLLLPGPLENTHNGLETLQPQHRAMIKKVGIMMTLQDLTPMTLDQCYQAMQAFYGLTVMGRPSVSQGIRSVNLAEKDIWKEKLTFVLDFWEDFVIFRIINTEGPEESDSKDMKVFREEDDDTFRSPHMRSMRIPSRRAAKPKHIRLDVEDIVNGEGWKAIRALLKE